MFYGEIRKYLCSLVEEYMPYLELIALISSDLVTVSKEMEKDINIGSFSLDYLNACIHVL